MLRRGYEYSTQVRCWCEKGRERKKHKFKLRAETRDGFYQVLEELALAQEWHGTPTVTVMDRCRQDSYGTSSGYRCGWMRA